MKSIDDTGQALVDEHVRGVALKGFNNYNLEKSIGLGRIVQDLCVLHGTEFIRGQLRELADGLDAEVLDSLHEAYIMTYDIRKSLFELPGDVEAEII